MNVYGKENLPKLSKPSGKKYYYSTSKNLNAIDTSTIELNVKNELSILKSDIETAITNFNKQLQLMETAFGTKFIAINKQPLGFVDSEAFNTLTKSLVTTTENSEEISVDFFKTCQEKTEEINNWLKELKMNHDILMQYERQYMRCINSNNEECQSQAATYKSLMNEFQRLPGEPFSYGDWIQE